jgi:hypothetical protein
MSAATNRVKKCRAHAEQCRAWSELATSEATRKEFLKVAGQWETLAREIDDIERMRVFTITAGRTHNPSL